MFNRILSDIYSLELSPDKRDHRLASQVIMLFIEQRISSNSLLLINEFLKVIDISKLNAASIIGLVRCTWRVKDLLPEWNNIYELSWKRAIEINRDPHRLFVGLPPVVSFELTS